MYPILQPGSLVLVDDARRKIVDSGWTTEFDRPIYLLERREGWVCGWCSLNGSHLIVHFHPTSQAAPQVFVFPEQIDVVGQVTGVAMRLGPVPRRRTRP